MTLSNRASQALGAVRAAASTLWRRRVVRGLAFSLLALLLVALAGFGLGLWWLHAAAQAALPVLDGQAQVRGLAAPVVVRRDAHGVPHIEATSQADLFMAQGYVTAQDRLWQMDLLRRNARGELSEILGPSMLSQDKAQRVLGFRTVAERVYVRQSPEERARFEAYARGVNLFIEQHQNNLPPEFRLLAYKPRPWTGQDSLAIGLLVVQMLDTHWETKLAHLHVMRKLNDESLEKDLYPIGSWRDHPPTGELHKYAAPPPPRVGKSTDDEDDEDDDGPSETRALPPGLKPAELVSTSVLSSIDPEAIDLAAIRAAMGLPTCEGCTPGSNNWVVSGAHTASGKPLLANDMHLGLMAPSIWYMADLKAPGYHAQGVTLPGMPFVIEGHNEHIAWGITALMGNVQDLYEEKLDGKGNYNFHGAGWQPLKVRHETIKVRGSHDVALDIESTDHGPLLTPILPNEKTAYALKWTIYDEDLNRMPVYRVNTASNWTDFTAALGDWCWPTLNMVYSDDQGHIGYHAVGRIPYSAKLSSEMGLNDVPYGYDPMNGRNEWGRWDSEKNRTYIYVPFEWMPKAFDPPSGFLATANARVTASNGDVIGSDWIDPYRVERIYKVLEGRDGLTPKDMLAVQTDVYSEVDQQFGQRFAYAIDHTATADARATPDPRLQQAARLLHDWDGRLTTDSAAASIVVQTRHALRQMILEPKLGKDWTEYEWGESNFALEEIVMRAKPRWLPKEYKSWDELMTAAVAKTLKDGKAPSDVSKWAYGSWHVVDVEHPVGRLLPFVSRSTGTGEQPQSGDTTTVKQVGRAFGPSQRFTMDWANIDGSTQNIVLGESGNPLSPYYRDQWNDWYSGTTFAFPFTEKAVAAATRHTLRLVPW